MPVKQQLEIVYVTDFYDRPLGGLCMYNGKIEQFKTNYDTGETEIIYLTPWQRFKALWSKKVFEICVGKHNSYVHNKKPGYFYWRKPAILHKILFSLYYSYRKLVWSKK